MNITTIKHQPLSVRENLAFKNAEVVKKTEVNKEVKPATTKETAWQQNILLDAISSLENNLQLDNNHPLGRADYRPIEDFKEAESLLPFFKTETFLSQALAAQANIRPEDVVALFNEN